MENKSHNFSGLKKIVKAVVISAIVVAGLIIAGIFALWTGLGNSENSRAVKIYSDGMMQESSLSGSAMDLSYPESASSLGEKQKSVTSPNASSADSQFETEAVDKKVVKNGSLSLKVDSVDEAVSEISQVAEDNGGDIASSNIYQNSRKTKNGYVTVKVPVANFSKTFSDLKKIGTLVVRESTSSQDVTEAYTDLVTQIKNKRAEEQAYLKILDQAQKIDDVLAVTRQISSVRGQIESLQGRKKYMDSQTSMSQISIKLAEDVNVAEVSGWRPWQTAKESFNNLVRKSQGFVDFLIRLLIVVIPVFVLYGILMLVLYKIGKKIIRKIRKKKEM